MTNPKNSTVDTRTTPEDIDTEVRIPETPLCWISGEHIEDFTKELQAVITKYASEPCHATP